MEPKGRQSARNRMCRGQFVKAGSDAPLAMITSKGPKVLGSASLVIALALFVCIDRYYTRATTHPFDLVVLWLFAQYCIAAVLSCFWPTSSARKVKEKLLVALLIGSFMGGATLPKVVALFSTADGPQAPWWVYQIPFPAISVTACTQTIMVAAVEAALWAVAYAVAIKRKS
jgi:hypothetical protein